MTKFRTWTETITLPNGRTSLREHYGDPVDAEVVAEHKRGERPDDAATDAARASGRGALADLLDEVRSFIARFCAFPSDHALVAVALWSAHTHVIEHYYSTPRLALLSPEPGSGKTRVLEVVNLLVPNPMFSISASTAAIFRSLASESLTLLFDEVDTIFVRRGKDDANEELRALLNAGYKRGETIPRCVGPKHEVVRFPLFAPAALAGLGELPDTLMSRSVIIRMRRRAPGESIEPFRSRTHEPQGHALRDRLAKLLGPLGPEIGSAEPRLPLGVVDRPGELWEPLVALADAAGGHWPATAREACSELVRSSADRRASLGVRLLTDLRTVFTMHELPDALSTDTILNELHMAAAPGLEDAPWADLGGKPIDPRKLARMLKQYGVAPRKVRLPAGGAVRQGYRREDLADAWSRYCTASPTPAEAEQAEHPEHEAESLAFSTT